MDLQLRNSDWMGTDNDGMLESQMWLNNENFIYSICIIINLLTFKAIFCLLFSFTFFFALFLKFGKLLVFNIGILQIRVI